MPIDAEGFSCLGDPLTQLTELELWPDALPSAGGLKPADVCGLAEDKEPETNLESSQ